jgi:glutamate/tyrosine decarboxylase-like PLP-dependent enzyme
MRERLQRLEAISRRLDPDPDGCASLGARAGAYVEDFLRRLPELPAYDAAASPGDGSRFAVGEGPSDLDAALEIIETLVTTPGATAASGGAFAYVPGGGLFPAALGDLIADVTNSYSGIYFASPGAMMLERSLVRWMAELLHYPASAGGDLTSGGSIGSLSAVIAAREAYGIRGRDVDRAVVYLTELGHHCLTKALRVAGLGECVVRKVRVDGRWRMDAADLDRMIEADRKSGLHPWMVIGSAGTTDTGSVDPLAAIADIAAAHGLWFHCDAAYGGFFLLTGDGRARLTGIDRSQSAVLDPHKSLFLPFGTGAIVVRDERQLAAAFSATANYMQDARGASTILSPADLGPELTRPFRGLRMWLPLKLFGIEAFRASLEEKLLLARHFHAELRKAPGFDVGPEPELSVVTYRYRPDRGDADEFNRKLLGAVNDEGRCFISSTMLDGRFTLRFAALHFRSHLEQVELLLESLQRHARRLASSTS